jgi:hypothetical protein
MRERETHQKNMKNQTKSIPKTMKHRYKFHARKSDAKKLGKTQKLVPKRIQKMKKKRYKGALKNESKRDGPDRFSRSERETAFGGV